MKLATMMNVNIAASTPLYSQWRHQLNFYFHQIFFPTVTFSMHKICLTFIWFLSEQTATYTTCSIQYTDNKNAFFVCRLTHLQNLKFKYDWCCFYIQAKSGLVRTHSGVWLHIYGHIWTYMDLFGPVWTYMNNQYGHIYGLIRTSGCVKISCQSKQPAMTTCCNYSPRPPAFNLRHLNTCNCYSLTCCIKYFSHILTMGSNLPSANYTYILYVCTYDWIAMMNVNTTW